MHLIVPYLFPPVRLLDVAADGLRLPAFETLLARGTRSVSPAQGVEAVLAAALGLPAAPLAPITLLADSNDPGLQRDGHYWLRADPVHLRVMRDRIVLADSSMLDLAQGEADRLCADIAAHFGASLNPFPIQPQRWYLHCDPAPRLATTPLSLAVGRDIDALQASGGDAMQYRSLLNELQMLLYEHPINQAREARGALAVNSLWLWGGGVLPTRIKANLTVHADAAELRALAQFCGATLHPVPDDFSAKLMHDDVLIELDQLRDSGQYGDAYGWREAMIALERNWFAPLLAAGHRVDLRIEDPVHGIALTVLRRDYWKVWRRRHPLVAKR